MLPRRPTPLPIVKPKLISEQALGFKSEVYFFHREIINVPFLPFDSLKANIFMFLFYISQVDVLICYEILHKQLETHNKNSKAD